jgi:hypothetical protein
MASEQVKDFDETAYSWDDFKAGQAKLQRSEATTCPYCYTEKVEIDGAMKCPAGCDDDESVRPNWNEILA